MKETVAPRFLLAFLLIFAAAPARARAAAAQLTTRAELDELSRNGPAIPSTLNGDEIMFRGLFKWDWSLVVAYELARPSAVTVTVAVDGHNHLISYTYPKQPSSAINALTATMRHACTIPLPGGIGGATYSIKAVADTSTTSSEPLLTIRAIAAGPLGDEGRALDDDLLSPPANFPSLHGARLTEAAYSPDPQTYLTAVPLGLGGLSFTPPRIPVVGGKPSESAAYSFRISLPFNSVRAEIKRYNDRDRTWRSVNVQEFGPGLAAGKVIKGDWDCMDGRAPSLGKHSLWVKAWRTIARDGKWSLVTSEPVSIY